MFTAFHATAQHDDAPLAGQPAIDERSADVVIIGGGPGGSTAGALLAEKGWRVLLLEKDQHPRFHIGESLLPLNLPLFEQLGCAPAIKKVGLVKNSVQFHSIEHQASQTFAFADAWDGLPKYAYQVRRSEFDLALLQHARGRGVEVIESYLAMNSAQLAVDVIDVALRDPSAAPRLDRAFERRVRRGLKTFTWIIYRKTSPIMRDLIMRPRDIFGVQRAVISFLAGDVYDPGPVRRRVMAFRGIYYLSALKHWRRAWRTVLNRKNATRPQTIYATDGSG